MFALCTALTPMLRIVLINIIHNRSNYYIPRGLNLLILDDFNYSTGIFLKFKTPNRFIYIYIASFIINLVHSLPYIIYNMFGKGLYGNLMEQFYSLFIRMEKKSNHIFSKLYSNGTTPYNIT